MEGNQKGPKFFARSGDVMSMGPRLFPWHLIIEPGGDGVHRPEIIGVSVYRGSERKF